MYTGLTGKIHIAVLDNNEARSENTVAATEVAYISNWSVEDTVELIEVSELGKRTKSKLAGQRGWTASAEGAIEFSGSKGHKALFEAMHEGKEVACEFYLDDKTKFKGTGLIESLSVDLSAEDKGNISISISGTDELIYPGKTVSQN